jgi:hypothetical protein
MLAQSLDCCRLYPATVTPIRLLRIIDVGVSPDGIRDKHLRLKLS